MRIATIILLTILSFNANAKCQGGATLFVYNDDYGTSSTNLVAFINPGDYAHLKILGSDLCPPTLLMMRNADTVMSGLLPGFFPQYFMLTDTGYYFLHFVSSAGDWTWSFTLKYFTTTDIGVSKITPFQICPSLSTGIFKIKSSSTDLKQLRISDSAGRIVLSSAKDFSEIDLTNFSSGVYFYAITDEKENVWQGRIVKE